MNIDDVIKGRRSIRTYKSDEVKEVLIREIIEAATFAPSAKNSQSWRFTVLTSDSKNKFTDMYRSELDKSTIDVGSSYGSCTMMEEAPVVIVVWNTNELGWTTEVHSVSAAIQNILLKAHSLGLGTCWIGDIFYTYEAIVDHFKKPWKLLATITVGWSDVKPGPRPRLSVDDVTEFLN
ncbi:MAG: nitroreductase family protein [Candidatus Thorarchaeota archaeon]|nr:nitroreductase family protein [Candidatus Thorarchaeota archaeon]